MRKQFLFSALLVLVIAIPPDKDLNGSWKISKAFYGNDKEQYNIDNTTIVKLFKDGYWISAFYGNPDKPFGGCGGGTYSIKKGKYIETLAYYSWDSTAVGTTNTFQYRVENNKYFQEGKINTDKYKDYLIKEEYEKIVADEPLKNTALEGAWQMEEGIWGKDKLGEGDYKNVSVIKIYAYPRFAFAYYNPVDKKFVGAGGGTYQFDGSTLTENIQYWSWGTPEYPVSVFKVQLSVHKFMQQGWDNNLKETWKQLK